MKGADAEHKGFIPLEWWHLGGMEAKGQQSMGGLKIGKGKASDDSEIPHEGAARMIAIARKQSQKAGEEPAQEITGKAPRAAPVFKQLAEEQFTLANLGTLGETVGYFTEALSLKLRCKLAIGTYGCFVVCER